MTGRAAPMHLDMAAPQRVTGKDQAPTNPGAPAGETTPQTTKLQSTGAGNCNYVACGEHRPTGGRPGAPRAGPRSRAPLPTP
jgi:hypothetical protein